LADVDVRLLRPRMHELPARLLERPEIHRRAVWWRDPKLLGKLATRCGQRVLARPVLALRERPCTSVAASPKRAAHVDEHDFQPVLGLAAIQTSAASAAPLARIATFRAKAVPIPKPGGGSYPHTGNCLGCGAAVEAEYVFEGSGYGATAQNPNGGIPPISQVNFYL